MTGVLVIRYLLQLLELATRFWKIFKVIKIITANEQAVDTIESRYILLSVLALPP